eukprot:jgi/Picsp_1/1358/NSC_04837-R2_transducin wd40 domain-containing protein
MSHPLGPHQHFEFCKCQSSRLYRTKSNIHHVSNAVMSESGNGCIAKRAASLRKGPLSYIDAFVKAIPDLWSEDNKSGWIPTVVAENKLECNPMFFERMLRSSKPDGQVVMNYGNMKGMLQLQKAFIGLLNRTFVSGVQLEPEHVCLLSGSSCVLESLFFCIADSNDGVLIPTPYYPAFDNDLQARCAAVPVGFELNEEAPITQQLEEAVTRAEKESCKRVRALLITNPNNPLGIIYKEETVMEMMTWCIVNKIHYVSDEIYGNSVHKQGERFKSALCLLSTLIESGSVSEECAQNYFHFIYGLSKDWCASGLRIGMLYSRNAPLQQALNSLAPFGSISNHQQHTVADVLSDQQWTSDFIYKNNAAIRRSYQILVDSLESCHIPYVPAAAGIFVWIDLTAYLPHASWEGEKQLWESICDNCKVILTPGESCHASKPGFFRLCFAWVPPEALRLAIQRIQNYLS